MGFLGPYEHHEGKKDLDTSIRDLRHECKGLIVKRINLVDPNSSHTKPIQHVVEIRL